MTCASTVNVTIAVSRRASIALPNIISIATRGEDQ